MKNINIYYIGKYANANWYWYKQSAAKPLCIYLYNYTYILLFWLSSSINKHPTSKLAVKYLPTYSLLLGISLTTLTPLLDSSFFPRAQIRRSKSAVGILKAGVPDNLLCWPLYMYIFVLPMYVSPIISGGAMTDPKPITHYPPPLGSCLSVFR